jgi:hypothetical protein
MPVVGGWFQKGGRRFAGRPEDGGLGDLIEMLLNAHGFFRATG